MDSWSLYHQLTYEDPNKVPMIEEEAAPEKKKLNPFTNTWYLCAKCGKKESLPLFAQTRKADEGFSTTVICACGEKFTIHG